MSVKLSDEEIIALKRSGDESHIVEIYNRYKNMVRIIASEMFLLGGDIQDLNQEGMIGLVKAINDYSFDKDAKFSTFADICVRRQLYNSIKHDNRIKNMFLNDYVSLTQEKVSEDGEPQGTLMDSLVGSPEFEPEGHFISQENVDRINGLIDSILTPRERDVFKLFLTGLSSSQIAAVLSVSDKSADNALQRAKAKLRNALTEN